ncbi:MAG TPA: glycosyltransferase family 2 protein [Ignavibacteria bacterium]|nr:glycosyltransferase family 2 protein [Ignavibacteria bacterium]
MQNITKNEDSGDKTDDFITNLESEIAAEGTDNIHTVKPRKKSYQKKKFRINNNRESLSNQSKNISGYSDKNQNNRNKSYSEKQQIQKSEDYTRIVPPGKMVSVVIPLLNEEESLMELSLSIRDVFDKLKCMYEVILIDDGSTDESFKTIKYIHSKNSRFHCIKFRKNYGKSAALQAGFDMARGDFIITMDADLQDDPNEIPELLKILNSGFDLVSGWKKVRHDPFIKKHTSKFFNYVTSKVSGVRLHDFNCGLKAYRKDVTKTVKIYGEMHRYIPALAHLSGFKVTEKPVKHHARKFGKTKYGISRFFNGFFDLLTVMFTTKYNNRPLHLFGLFGIISFMAGTLITVYLTVMKFWKGHFVSDRPLFLVGLIFIIVGVQFFSLGLIAEMITKSNAKNEEILVEATL